MTIRLVGEVRKVRGNQLEKESTADIVKIGTSFEGGFALSAFPVRQWTRAEMAREHDEAHPARQVGGPRHEEFMALALMEAREGLSRGERPFGSVLVYRGEVIGKGRNRAISGKDPILHAEIVAIQEAAHHLGPAEFGEATLYTTCEPCPMCCGATFFAGIPQLVLGVRFAILAQFSTRLHRYREYSVERLRDQIGFKLNIIDGILTNECEAIFRDWERRP